MKRGPKPKSLEQQLLDGNPGKRPLNLDAPRPTKGITNRPHWLTTEAKREWTRLQSAFETMGICETDRAVFTIYTEAWASYSHWAVEAAKTPDVKHVILERDKAFQRLMAAVDRLGLSPSGRTRLQVPPAKNVDELEEFNGLKLAQ